MDLIDYNSITIPLDIDEYRSIAGPDSTDYKHFKLMRWNSVFIEEICLYGGTPDKKDQFFPSLPFPSPSPSKRSTKELDLKQL